jgi:site-specific recombinase XerD
VRPRRPRRLPVVLTRQEAQSVFATHDRCPENHGQFAYGSGLRLLECARLRVKDIDFAAGHIVVRDGKGRKDRITLLPNQSRQPLKEHLGDVEDMRRRDLLGHSDVATTMIYTHVLNRGPFGVRSPID